MIAGVKVTLGSCACGNCVETRMPTESESQARVVTRGNQMYLWCLQDLNTLILKRGSSSKNDPVGKGCATRSQICTSNGQGSGSNE